MEQFHQSIAAIFNDAETTLNRIVIIELTDDSRLSAIQSTLAKQFQISIKNIISGTDPVSAVSELRAVAMDVLEQRCGMQSNWQFIRRRLLALFGDRGLSKQISELIACQCREDVETPSTVDLVHVISP